MKERLPIYEGKTYEEAIRRRSSVLESGAMDMTSSIIILKNYHDNIDTDSEGDEMLERADEACLEYGMNHHNRNRKRYVKK